MNEKGSRDHLLVVTASGVILTILLSLVVRYVPFLGTFCQLLLPLPLTIVIVRSGLLGGVLTAGGVLLAMGMMMGVEVALYFAVPFLLLGGIVGYGFLRQWPATQVLAGAVLVALAGMGGMLFFGGVSFGGIQGQLPELTDALMRQYQEVGLLDQLRAEGMSETAFRDLLTSMMALVVRLMPGFFALMAMIAAFVHVLFATAALKSMEIQVNKLPSFTSWHLPYWMLGVIAPTWGLWLARDQIPWPVLVDVGYNLGLVLATVCLVLGLSVTMHFTDFAKSSILMKMLFIFLAVLFIQGTVVVLTLVGVFDVAADFRKLRKNPSS